MRAESSGLTADEVLKWARRMRDQDDEAGTAVREKQPRDDRCIKVYRINSRTVRLNGLFAPEHGE
ncbi:MULTISPECIES: hypothetical protein [Cryobacterium]|uniref:DUF4258 domain-containing protein n=1 Tax=Cryobacterium breve TaxID=1259258 RepID=A0ABY2J5S6_9MICO|nr:MULTISPECIES: hypothetical protein [Cryobacterium]TFC95845.1 hypothetical protein E3T20_05715 [Cryobacterium sp. TmT3-12]TFD00284.1 hypothetical protein E3O65_04010 [Cryobacterium breve]